MNEHDMSTFWHWWVVILTLANIAGIYWLIRWTAKKRPGEVAEGVETGHSWDGLSEFNNPLPRWWLYMFYLTIVFALIYLVLYPGLGRYSGMLGWSSGNELNATNSQYQREMDRAEGRYGPIFQAMAARSLADLAGDEQALRTGQRLYLNYCSTCHGSDAGGAYAFPNLANGVWQWVSTDAQGNPNEQELIRVIAHGINNTGNPQTRMGAMPGYSWMDAATLDQVTHYVLQLSGRPDANPQLAAQGQQHFMGCIGCHGMDGRGNPMMGGPNLTENVWLYGGSFAAIRASIAEGRQGMMPGFADLIGDDRVKVLSAYVYSLGGN